MAYKQTILITGATGNIGGGAAVALAKRGTRLVLLGRSSDKLDARKASVYKALTEAGVNFQDIDIATLTVDFSDLGSVSHAASEAMGRFETVNGLILSVGAYIENGPNILPDGHEAMFSTNVVGPFLFTQLLIESMSLSDGLVLHVIAPFNKEIDWDDLESIKHHKTMSAFNRTKACNRIIAGELARRYAGKISSVAFDPGFVIDKSDTELKNRWPSGFTGFVWRIMTFLSAKHPSVAGEPIAELMLSQRDRSSINGALFKLYKRVERPDPAMNDKVSGEKLWNELASQTGILAYR